MINNEKFVNYNILSVRKIILCNLFPCRVFDLAVAQWQSSTSVAVTTCGATSAWLQLADYTSLLTLSSVTASAGGRQGRSPEGTWSLRWRSCRSVETSGRRWSTSSHCSRRMPFIGTGLTQDGWTSSSLRRYGFANHWAIYICMSWNGAYSLGVSPFTELFGRTYVGLSTTHAHFLNPSTGEGRASRPSPWRDLWLLVHSRTGLQEEVCRLPGALGKVTTPYHFIFCCLCGRGRQI